MAELLAANQITIAKVLDGEQGIPGEPGADGKTSYFHIKYSAVANPTSSSEMSETPLAYIGTYVDFTEADSTDPTKYTWSRFEGIQGEKGEQGIPGIGQDGRTSYLHIAYATSADGSEGFSISESANKTYIGQYTDFVSTDSTDYTKYAWTKIKGEMSAEQVAQLNKASQDASNAVSKVDNLEIGGRNLLKQYIRAGGRCVKIDNLTLKVGTEVADTYFYLRSHCALTAGETYTISCEASNVPDGCNWSFGVRAQSSAWRLYINKNGKNFATGVLDADINADTDFILDDYENRPSTAPNIILTNFKLEYGNKATDWTPAPEDVDTGIKNAAKTATNFINYDSTNGLVLGNKESGSWVGYRTQIDNDSFNVLDENGNIIASYGSNEVELGKGNPNAIIKMCDGKAYVKNYIVGSQNTSVFCGQDVTVVGEWEGASEAYALFKQGFINIGQASSHIKFSNENGNMNQVEIQGQNITINGELAFGTEADAAAARSNLGIDDYIVEQGTTNDWQYIKYASRKFIAWKYSTGSYTCTNASGNMHYSGVSTWNLPFTIVEGVANISLGQQCFASNVNVTTTTVNFRALRGAKASLTNVETHIAVHGTY